MALFISFYLILSHFVSVKLKRPHGLGQKTQLELREMRPQDYHGLWMQHVLRKVI